MLFCFCPAKGQWNSNDEIAYKFYQDSMGFYLIKYEYNPEYCTIPLTLPAGYPHYPALITVYQVVDNDTIQIGQPFDGTYVEKGCFEDVPEDQVKEAKSIIDVIETVPIKEYYLDTDIDSIWVKYSNPEYTPDEIVITLQDLLDYQKECYNDSTEVGYSYTMSNK